METVLDLVGFDERVRDVDLVITGEGNMDEQSAAGKAPVGVARRAKRYGKPVIAVVGGRADNLDAVYGQGIDLVLPICRKPMGLEQALDPQEATTNLICAVKYGAFLPLRGQFSPYSTATSRMAIRGWPPCALGRTVCHEMRPSTTLNRPPSTIPEFAKTKPQVESLPIFEKAGYG